MFKKLSHNLPMIFCLHIILV